MNLEHEGIKQVTVSAYQIPTDYPESDGTLEWDSTTMILVEIEAQEKKGIGYSYADASITDLINRVLKPLLTGQNPMNIAALWISMMKAIRNNGTSGLACMTVSAVDNALWDLKAKLLDQPLGNLLGMVRPKAAVYGSGGFTSYPIKKLQEQATAWINSGFTRVKIKIGRKPEEDTERIQKVHNALEGKAELMVDANGAYDAKTAIEKSKFFGDIGISWFEEPVGSDNLTGLNYIRNHLPSGIRVAAGEYGDQLSYFKQMLDSQAVDVLQADATRCCGITGFLKAGILAEAANIPFSFHCAPAIHLYPALALNSFSIGEYFHDHVRIENRLFDGVPQPVNGYLQPNLSLPGSGLIFKSQDASKYKVA